MRLHKALAASSLAISLTLSACANAPSPKSPQIAEDTIFNLTKQRGLPAPDLPNGACGLFLWGAGHGRPLQFFQNAALGDARLALQPDLPAKRVSANRAIVQGFYAKQEFTLGDMKVTVDLKPSQSRNVLKGIPVPAGRLVFLEASGRSTIIPVAGLFGCRN
jgi:hypothetical protein